MRARVSNLGPARTLPAAMTAVVAAGEAAALIAGPEPSPGYRCSSATSWTRSSPCGKVTYLGVVLLTRYIRGHGRFQKRRGNLKKACVQVNLKESHGVGLPRATPEERGKKRRGQEGRSSHQVVDWPLILTATPCS